MGKKSTKTIGSLAFLGMISALFYFAPLSFAKNVRAPEIISPTWINSEPLKLEVIFPWDTGHRVKNHIMIQNEVLNEKTTQVSQSGV